MKASLKNEPSRRRDRFDFAAKLVTLMKRKSFVWVVDETSHSLWARPRIRSTWAVSRLENVQFLRDSKLIKI